jgi:mono/diheme cytochrome c family protein
MKRTAINWLASASLFVAISMQLFAQGGARPPFPAQQRPPGDPAVIARGNGLYGVYCRACHGADLRGGDQGGPNLLRSPVVLNDQAGELIRRSCRTASAAPA